MQVLQGPSCGLGGESAPWGTTWGGSLGPQSQGRAHCDPHQLLAGEQGHKPASCLLGLVRVGGESIKYPGAGTSAVCHYPGGSWAPMPLPRLPFQTPSGSPEQLLHPEVGPLTTGPSPCLLGGPFQHQVTLPLLGMKAPVGPGLHLLISHSNSSVHLGPRVADACAGPGHRGWGV